MVAGVSLLVVLGVFITIRLWHLIVMVFVALFIAVALEPAVQFLVKRGWNRRKATGVVFLGAVVFFGLFIASLVPLFISQASSLTNSLPGYLAELQEWLASHGLTDIDLASDEISDQFEDIGSILSQYGARVAGGVFAFGNSLIGGLFKTATILLFAYYMVADGPKMRRTLLSVLSERSQREALRIWEIAVEKTGAYIYSRVILSIVAAAFTALVLTILGVDYAVALGLWVGVISQFIPVIGTYIAAVLPVMVALASGNDGTWHLQRALWVMLALVAYQQIENLLVAPRITAKAMSIHPAVAIGAVIAGAGLLGGAGAVLSLPVAATTQAVISTVIRRHELIESDSLVDEREEDRRERKGHRRTGRGPTPESPTVEEDLTSL